MKTQMQTKIRTGIAAACFLVSAGLANAQNYASSHMVLVSEDKYAKAIEYSIETSYMVLNLSTGDFTLNADLSDLVTGSRRLDSLLRAKGEQPLVFKGNISENVLTYSQQQNDEQTYDMPGQLLFNDNTTSCTAQFDPINLADKNEIKNYRMDFRLALNPDNLNIKLLEGRFSNEVVLVISGGKLNIQN